MTEFINFLSYTIGTPITAKIEAFNAKGWSAPALSTGSVLA